MLFHTAYRIWEYIEACNDKIVDVYTGEITREITGKTCICNGAGIKVHSNGDIEEGYWINGLPLMSKKSRRILKCGCYEIMEPIDDESNRKGIVYSAEKGAKLIGKFSNSTKYGKGEIYYDDGTKYVGEWSSLNKHGQGILYSLDGKILKSGIWENDQFIGT